MSKSKRRLAMGEEAWTAYQIQRNRDKSKNWKSVRSTHTTDARRRAKQKLIDYKGGKCEMCGFNKPYASCYDFHHIDPKTKEFNIGGAKVGCFEKLKAEVDKCMLLCKNCHAEIHHKEYSKQRDAAIQLHQKWLARQKERVEKICPICNHVFIAAEDVICCSYKCACFYRRKVVRPAKDELGKMLWEMPTTLIGKQFGVSDKAIEKWTKGYGLEKPPRGYWTGKTNKIKKTNSNSK